MSKLEKLYLEKYEYSEVKPTCLQLGNKYLYREDRDFLIIVVRKDLSTEEMAIYEMEVIDSDDPERMGEVFTCSASKKESSFHWLWHCLTL